MPKSLIYAVLLAGVYVILAWALTARERKIRLRGKDSGRKPTK